MAANFLRFVFKKLARHIFWYIMVHYMYARVRMGTQGGLILITRPYNDAGITSHLQKENEAGNYNPKGYYQPRLKQILVIKK